MLHSSETTDCTWVVEEINEAQVFGDEDVFKTVRMFVSFSL